MPSPAQSSRAPLVAAGPMLGGLCLTLAVVATALAGPTTQDRTPSAQDRSPFTEAEIDEGTVLFEETVGPLLAATCFECHGPELARVKGGLRLGDREGLLRGGNSGSAIDLDEPAASLIVEAVRHSVIGLEMPPDRRLEQAEADAIERWIELGAPWPSTGIPSTPEELAAVAHFEREVRPLLAANCFECHGPALDEVQGELRMSGRAALLAGGARGPAIVPGDPGNSLLIDAVRYQHATLAMPPTGRLDDRQIEALEVWIAAGAPWPGGTLIAHDHVSIDVEGGRGRWPFTPLERPSVPDSSPSTAPIDAFVRARLAAAGIAPNPRADERDLVRRVYFDLTGLPPTQAAVESYLADATPDRWERLVERLLASPRFGEHWARMWLDVVRYSQTNGFEHDAEKPYAWRYRDWVVEAFDADMPYDRFVALQLAGDEIEPSNPAAAIPTGVYRLGVFDQLLDDPLQSQFDEYDDNVRTITEGFLGLTVGCARCHDHKFDPITQDDYYELLGFVRNMRPYEIDTFGPNGANFLLVDGGDESREDSAIALAWEKDFEAERARVRSQADELIAKGRRLYLAERIANQPLEVQEAYETPPRRRTKAQRELVAPHLASVPDRNGLLERLSPAEREDAASLVEGLIALEGRGSFEGEFEWILAAREWTDELHPIEVFARGDPTSPVREVQPGFVDVLCPDDAAARPLIPRLAPDARTTGRRKLLADWIASPDNPLTARVMANRLWKGLFGRGLVPTPNDFGASGLPATHPELLDWLASDFVDDGWSVKGLLRTIVHTETYRASTGAGEGQGARLDPANELLWRQNLRRLTAEGVRDAMLVVTGELQHLGGGRGTFSVFDREVLAGMSRPGEGLEIPPTDAPLRRSVYSFAKRGILDPLAVALDLADPIRSVGARSVTTTPTQALMLFNGRFVDARARAVAGRTASTDDPVGAMFGSVLGREPSAEERELAASFLERQADGFRAYVPGSVLEPRIPDRVSIEYLRQLSTEQVLDGPRSGFNGVRGRFHRPYAETVEIDPARGPAHLVDPASFVKSLGPDRRSGGRIGAQVVLHDGCSLFSVLFSARPAGDVFVGLEAVIDVVAGTVKLVRHDADPEAAPLTIATGPCAVEIDQVHAVTVGWSAGSAFVEVDGEQVLVATSLAFDRDGTVGLRCWGGAVTLRRFEVRTSGGTFALTPDESITPERRALVALASVLMNTNEFVHIP